MVLFLKAFGGCLVGAIVGILTAFIGVCFVWPKLVGGIDWDAIGPGGFVIFFKWACILALVGGVVGALITSRIDKKDSSVMDSSGMGFFFWSLGIVGAIAGAYIGAVACYRFFAALYQRY